ncbi:MAG: cbb3-type cytochrome c oxidase subunit I [Chloroflexi bacterium]|nr:cbb3-type cytochrome c oxidase subunit I [Chloroflexota bacterium]
MATVTDERLNEVWSRPPGILGFFSAVNNSTIGMLFIFSSWGFFLIAGGDSLALRTQLAVPESDLISAGKFNQLFTTHGTAMMFLFAVPMLEAIAIFILPLVLGARDMAFPRMSAFSFWTFLFSGLLFYSSTLPDIVNFVLPGNPIREVVPDTGWFAYPPLSGPEYSPGIAIDFYLIGLGAAEFAGIGAAIEIIVTIFKFRAPGMTLNRIPLYAWGLLAMAFAILFAFPAVMVSSTLLELERKFGLPFYDPARGGDPLLWQQLFWIFGHPEVYIMFIPATAIVSMIVPVFARRPIVGYTFVAMAIVATGFLSFGLWVHHMFAVGLPLLAMSLFGAASMMITIPSGVQVFSWLATMLTGPRLVLNTPMLYCIGFLITFVLGGITGVMVASVPFDLQVHDTYFVVAHFHYVLVGGVVFPIIAAFYYWMPKITGKMYDEWLGKLGFWLFFIGFNLTFLPQHNAGLLGMPRRVFTYGPDLGLWPYNLISTIGAYVMGLAVIAIAVSLYRSYFHGEPAPTNPWNADTLEWSVPTPTPNYNFFATPLVRSRNPVWDNGPAEWRPNETRGQQDQPERLWREGIGTTLLEARPESIIRIAGPSIWPFAAGVAVSVASFALLFDLYLITLLSVLVSIVFGVLWMWPTDDKRRIEGAGATLGNPALPVYTSGAASPDWWAMALTVAALAITHLYFIFSYFYLLYDAPAWPPNGIALPDLLLPFVSTSILLASAAPMVLADRAVRRSDQGRLRLGLGAGFLLGAAFLAVQGYTFWQSGLDARATSYSAIFLTVGWAHLAMAAGGLFLSLLVQAQAWLGYFHRERFGAVENMALYWCFVVGAWLATLATLYLTPYLL